MTSDGTENQYLSMPPLKVAQNYRRCGVGAMAPGVGGTSEVIDISQGSVTTQARGKLVQLGIFLL